MGNLLFDPPRLDSKRFLQRVDAIGEHRYPFSLAEGVMARDGQAVFRAGDMLFKPDGTRQCLGPMSRYFLGYDCLLALCGEDLFVFGQSLQTRKTDAERAAITNEDEEPLFLSKGQVYRQGEEVIKEGVVDIYYAGSSFELALVVESNEKTRLAWKKRGLPLFDHTVSWWSQGSGLYANGFLPNPFDPKNSRFAPRHRLFLSRPDHLLLHELGSLDHFRDFLDNSQAFDASIHGYIFLEEGTLFFFDREMKRVAYFPWPKDLLLKSIRENKYGTLAIASRLDSGEDVAIVLPPRS